MSGKSLLARIMGTTAVSAAATAVAAGSTSLSTDEQARGTTELEGIAETAFAQGRAEGVTAERERFGAVLSNEASTDRMGLAITMLSTTDNTADQVIACLKADAPKAAAASAAPVATQPAPQPIAGDPLRPAAPAAGADSIASETPLVDLGKSGGDVALTEPEKVKSMWDGALASVGGGSAILAGGPWGSLAN